MKIDLARIDSSVNMDRFYYVQLTTSLFGDIGVERLWGRRGTRGRQRLDWYESETAAKTALLSLTKQKLTRGYLSKSREADR